MEEKHHARDPDARGQREGRRRRVVVTRPSEAPGEAARAPTAARDARFYAAHLDARVVPVVHQQPSAGMREAGVAGRQEMVSTTDVGAFGSFGVLNASCCYHQ